MPLGTLYLIPVPLADDAAAKSFTPYLVDTINNIKEYIWRMKRQPAGF